MGEMYYISPIYFYHLFLLPAIFLQIYRFSIIQFIFFLKKNHLSSYQFDTAKSLAVLAANTGVHR